MGVWSKEHLVESVKHLARSGVAKERDYYEFGVYRGESLDLIGDLFYAYQVPVGRGWGFDSFEGLPAEAEGVPKFYLFQPGVFSDIGPRMWPTGRNITLVKGWFSDLRPEHVPSMGMGLAGLVHIDGDLYISAMQALDFMFGAGLVTPGTVIAYDEFKSVEPLWDGGEAKAHKEIAQKYKVTFREIFRNEYMDRLTCWQNAFEVVRFGEANHGVNDA